MMGDYAWSARRAALVLVTHFSTADSRRGYLCVVTQTGAAYAIDVFDLLSEPPVKEKETHTLTHTQTDRR